METPELLPAPPHVVGPTWRKTVDDNWWLPEKTLGWDLINWMAEYILQPGGENAGEPFLPTLEQARFLLWWYAVDDTGRFIYRNGILRRMKGWGKDPIVAAMSLAELCGPVAFSHFAPSGEPVGKPRPSAWIQVAAVSQDQTRNTFTLFPAMTSSRLKEEFGLEIHKTIIYTKKGGMIEGVTSSPLSLEGKRPTFVILNEVQWWIETNDGHEMFNIIEGNVTKSAGGVARYLAICNAHIPGQDSVGERLWESYQAVQGGQALDTRILYDALEAPADTPVSEIPPYPSDPDNPDYDQQLEAHLSGLDKLKNGLRVARGDAVWLDIDTIVASILDINNAVTESRRKFLNQINASEDSWISPPEWDSCFAEVGLEPGDRIALGFDGSKSNDWTALVACRIEDGALFPIRIWNPDNYPGKEIPRDQVDATVRWTFAKYEVVAMRADVKEFEAYVDLWGTDFKKQMWVNASPNNPIAFDMRAQQKRFALDCERFLDAVIEGEVIHDGDRTLRQHVLNAHRHPTQWETISIRKASKDSSRKIDAAVCAVLAFAARQDVLMSKKNRSRRAVALRGG